MTKVQKKWKREFRDFPVVPDSKLWDEDGPFTLEHLEESENVYGKDLDQNAENELIEATNFYKKVIPYLNNLNLGSLSPEEFDDFMKYFNYAFGHLVFVQNNLYADEIVRLVINESVIKKNERIRWKKDLSYPPLEVVKEFNVYNRANTPAFNVFYGATCIDSTLKELKPEIGKIVTAGIWKLKNPNVPLSSYPICHNSEAISINEHFEKGYRAFQKLRSERNPLMMDFLATIFEFLSNEFAKPIRDKRDYFMSATYSDRILNYNADPNFKFDCIVYPSVGNSFSTECLAIKPEIINDRYILSKVIEFKIEETNYNKIYDPKSREEITLVKFSNYSTTDWIDKDGYIVW